MEKPSATMIGRLKLRAFSLGAANAFDYGMQFILPVVLVRFLPQAEFGGYRLFWLMVVTAMTVIPLSMPGALYFFLPRAGSDEKRLHVHHTLLYLLVAGSLGGLLCGPWNPLLPASMGSLAAYGMLVPLLVMLFAVTLLLDVLPSVDERVHWQAGIIVGLTLVRTTALAWGAWHFGSLDALLWLLLALMLFKLVLLAAYVWRTHGFSGPWLKWPTFARQFNHAAPLGVSSALYGLRSQADQWVAAKVFALTSFAAFSIAAVLAPMVYICRQSVNYVFLPTMSRLQACGNLVGMVELNGRANVMVATLVYPLLTFVFAFSEEIITLIYTRDYIDAAPVMRIYIVGLSIFVVELSSIMLLLREGAFAWRLNVFALVGSIAVSWLGAQHLGLPGAALGSTLALYGDRAATLYRIATATGIPVAQLQNWPALGRLFAFAVLASSAAFWVVGSFLAEAGLLPRLFAGGSVVIAIYGALWLASDLTLSRLPVERDSRIAP